MGDAIDERPKTAVYSTTGSQRDRRAVELLRAFCALYSLRCVFYLDRKMPQEGQSNAWSRLLQDISEGKFDGVITWMQSPEMEQFCAEHGTKYLELDPFDWFQTMRAARVNILR